MAVVSKIVVVNRTSFCGIIPRVCLEGDLSFPGSGVVFVLAFPLTIYSPSEDSIKTPLSFLFADANTPGF